MQQGMQIIDLATALDDDRARQIRRHRLAAAAHERAGPVKGIRRRIGRRLITVGERMAYGRSQVATR